MQKRAEVLERIDLDQPLDVIPSIEDLDVADVCKEREKKREKGKMKDLSMKNEAGTIKQDTDEQDDSDLDSDIISVISAGIV